MIVSTKNASCSVRMRSWKLAAAFTLSLLTLIAAPMALAGEEPSCRDECSEARRTCRRAAHVAQTVCREQCATHTQAAIERAREICLSQSLSEEECGRVVAQAVKAALEACHGECREVAKRARGVCNEERRECVATCTADLDPTCTTPCFESFDACRDDLRVCASECSEVRNAAFQECREMADRETNPEGLRECLQQARQAARECRGACHAELPCGSDLGACLGECVEPVQ